MVAALRAIAVVLVVCAVAGDARADKLAVANVSAEPDLADEAGAVTLLARSALLGDDRVVIDAPSGITVGSALAMLDTIGAQHAVLMDLGRDGMMLRLTLAIVTAKAAPVVKVVRSGDGDVVALARDAADHVTGTLNLAKGRVPQVALGRLRPFAVALRLRASDPAGAAGALADGDPSVTLAVPAIGTLLAGLPAAAVDPMTGVIAARVLGDRGFLDKVGGDASELAAAARALSAIARTDTGTARTELGISSRPARARPGVALLAAAILAELAGDRAQLGAMIKRGLASDQMRPVLAFASSVETLDNPTLATLVTAAEKIHPNAPGVTSRIGLFAALAGVEAPRALALISARQVDALDLDRLERLVATGSDAASLRLRAELALRRAEDRAAVAIGTFASEAPHDPRSARYQGWLLASKGKFTEAAKALEKAGARREMLRALAAARDYAAALRAIDGKPTTAEELALLGQSLLETNKLGDAAQTLALAEQAAPLNPLVQGILARLFARQANKERTQLAWMLSGMSGAPPEAVEVSGVATSGGSAQVAKSDRVVIDLEDPRVFEPMLDALQLGQLAKSKLVIAELAWEPGMFAFRETHPDVVRGAVAKVLANAPYEMQITHARTPFTGEKLPLDELVKLTADADAVVIFHVEPAGSSAEITLMLFEPGGTQAIQVTRVVALPGAIAFNTGKLILVLAVVLVLVLAVILRATRSMGKLEIQIPRNVEKDEALCIEVTKNPKRPPIVDLTEFHTATKTAGTITKRFLATLVGTQTVMKVPSGVWYVHLYGTYTKGGKLRAVPESCSRKVELRRGDFEEIVFDLVPKLADVTVEVVYEPRKDIVVWANDEHARRRLDADGKAELQLPVGNHRINVQTATDTITQMLHVPSPKSIRIGINVTRELRLMKDLELDDTGQAGELELVLTGGPRTPLPGTLDKAAAEAVARTQALTPAQAAAASLASAKARSSIPGPGETLLDRYKITEELGRGAMGIVHRGWDEKLEREVAIKLMADDLRAIPEAMQLFTSEARALAQLNHTNIVAMYDQVTDVDKVYMIMEFVDGRTLESMIAARGALPWFEAASIIDQVCAGLAYAHARKVIHRDIKPANIFVAHDKTVKLGDFGLARVMREVTIRRTEVRGTPLYMAPEQITGTDIDHRTDLYAVGCTLFELVTGRPPFIEGDIMYAQMNAQAPAPSTFAPDLPAAVDDLILALLSKNPDDRPGSASVVRTALRDLSTI